MGTSDQPRPRLADPPRRVPMGVRARLGANTATAVGAGIFAVCSAVAVVCFLSARLWRETREAPGRLVRVERTSVRPGTAPRYRVSFTFRTPDGVEHRGEGYTSRPYRVQAGVDIPEAKRPKVTVEYVPGRSEVSRIKGADDGSPKWLLALAFGLISLVGLTVVSVSLWSAAIKARLLASGETAPATVVSCEVPVGSETRRLSFEEYRDRLSRKGVNPPTIVPSLPFGPGPETFARGFMAVWTGLAVVFGVVGTIFLGIVLALILTGTIGPGTLNGRPSTKAQAATFTGLMLVAWVAISGVMVRSGVAMRRKLRAGDFSTGRGAASEAGRPPVSCTYEFKPLSDSAPLRAKDSLAIGPDSSPGVTALYDPDWPARSLLIEALPGTVRVSESGAWEVVGAAGAWLRLALAALALVAGPVLGWVAWSFFPT